LDEARWKLVSGPDWEKKIHFGSITARQHFLLSDLVRIRGCEVTEHLQANQDAVDDAPRPGIEAEDSELERQPVAMRVNGATACTATTATNGVATCTAPLIYLLGITLHGYTATYPGTSDYQPATGHAGLLG